jgi:outer membrane murein-binding lipoprotein Lpp
MADDLQPKIVALLDALSEQVATVVTTVAALGTKVDALDAKVDALDAKVDQIDGAMRFGFARIERRLGNVETRLEGLEGEFKTFRIAIDVRVSTLESKFP